MNGLQEATSLQQLSLSFIHTHTPTQMPQWNESADVEAAWEWCNWLFQAYMLTLAVPSSLRLMMSKSKSLLRPSVLLRTMCPVSPSHCAYRERDAEGERSGRWSQMVSDFSVEPFWSSGAESQREKWRRSSGSDKLSVWTAERLTGPHQVKDMFKFMMADDCFYMHIPTFFTAGIFRQFIWVGRWKRLLCGIF